MAWGMLGTPKGGLINLAWTWLTGRAEPIVNVYSYGGIVWHMMQYSTPFLFLLMVGAFKSMDPVARGGEPPLRAPRRGRRFAA